MVIVFGTVPSVDAAVITGEAQVLDGDTIRVGPVSVRLHGIDAPEDGQSCDLAGGGSWRCDTAAQDRLSGLVDGRSIACAVREVDAYGRLVSVCEIDGADVGRRLVEEGLAWAFVEYADDYAALEADARDAGRGLWRDGSDPQTPAAYRANR